MEKLEMTQETFHLLTIATQERLEERFHVVVKFGDRVILAGHYYTGEHSPSWYSAVYRFTGPGRSCEDTIALWRISDQFFEDEGHALQWAMKNSDEWRRP